MLRFTVLFLSLALNHFHKPKIVFRPDNLNKIEKGITKHVYWYILESKKFFKPGIKFHISYYFNRKLIEISGRNITTSCIKSDSENYSFELKAKSVGKTEVLLILKPFNCSTFEALNFDYIYTYHVNIIRTESVWSNVFKFALIGIITLNYVNIGCRLDVMEIIEVLKQPTGPVIGFFNKFLFMPLISLGTGYLLLSDWHLRLGLLALGCSPGGNTNILWSVLLNGDINLSITMIFINRLAALALTPLWFFALETKLFYKGQFTLSYFKMIISLVTLICPLGMGILIRHFKPNWANTTSKIIRPFTIIIIIVAVATLSFVKKFIFMQITWKVIVSCLCLVLFGFFLSIITACFFRLEKSQLLVIGIETSFQNGGLAFLMIRFSLPQTDADIAEVPVITQFTLSILSMSCILIFNTIKKCLIEKNDGFLSDKHGLNEVKIDLNIKDVIK